MPKAICPHCHQDAYSSAEFNRPWTCPTCSQVVIPSGVSRSQAMLLKDPVVERYTKFWMTSPESPR